MLDGLPFHLAEEGEDRNGHIGRHEQGEGQGVQDFLPGGGADSPPLGGGGEGSRQEQQLSTPIQQKLTDAIKAVGAEGGFSFIMPKDGLLLYQGNDVVDVTPQIRTKLGI